MKKIFYSLVCAMVALASCKPTGNNGPVIVNPGDILVNKNEVLDADIQKQKLEQVANKSLTVFDSKEFKDLAELCDMFYSHADRYYTADNYDWSDLEYAGEDIWEDLYSEKKRSDYKWEMTYTLFLSNCTGVVTFGKKAATYDRSDETKVVFENIEGENWEATLVSKNLKEVYLGEWVETYYYDQYEDKYEVTVEVPESLVFQVKKGDESIAKVTAMFDYSISEGGVDYEQDRIGVSLEIQVDDVVVKLSKMSADAKTGALSYDVTVMKNGMFVASQKVSSVVDYDLDVEDRYIVDGDVDAATVSIETNILGEVQFKGTCSNMIKLADIVDQNYDTQKQAERAAEKALELMDMAIYYDGTSQVQAKIEFEPVADLDYYGNVYGYYLEPVIVFWDESRYLFYEYFEDGDFDDFLDNLEDFLYDYEEMVEGIN